MRTRLTRWKKCSPRCAHSPPRAAARALDAVGYPTTLFYDARGVLAARHMGELSRAAVEERLGKLRRAP